jgi:hypothetical protein
MEAAGRFEEVARGDWEVEQRKIVVDEEEAGNAVMEEADTAVVVEVDTVEVVEDDRSSMKAVDRDSADSMTVVGFVATEEAVSIVVDSFHQQVVHRGCRTMKDPDSTVVVDGCDIHRHWSQDMTHSLVHGAVAAVVPEHPYKNPAGTCSLRPEAPVAVGPEEVAFSVEESRSLARSAWTCRAKHDRRWRTASPS